MIRRLALFVALAVAASAASAALAAPAVDDAAPAIESPIQPRGAVIVNDDVVRLGDLFANVGDKASAPVAYAPEPGRRAVFDARWLYRVARAYGLSWRPASRGDRAVVTRESIVIGQDEIEGEVLAALAESGLDTDHVDLELSNRHLRLHLPASTAAGIAVEDVAYDPQRGNFAAVLVASTDGTADRRMRVTGRVREMVDVPVLARRLRAGELIGAADLEWVSLPSRGLPRNVVMDAESLIGRTPRRGLAPGKPIRASDVRRPVLVARGDLVTIELTTPRMLLTARGRALEDGSRHDVVRVSNVQSGDVVDAVVTGPDRVTVSLPGRPVKN